MRRLITAVGGAAVVGGCVAGLLYLGPATESPTAAAPATGAPAAGTPAAGSAVTSALDTARKRTKAYPRDPVGWASLAGAEIEQARTTLDAAPLEVADHALRRSLALDGSRNYGAAVGLGQLANARHQFTRGREHGLRATRMAPDRPDGYAVLADAEIQLGHYPAARAAVQRLLDLAPGSAAYARAAYDLETNGRPDDAGIALKRAVDSASTPGERAFAQTRSGDLAWSRGQLDRAAAYYREALDTEPEYPYAVAGTARVLAARGEPGRALDTYERLTERTPLPQFLLEAVELRASMPRAGDAGPGAAEAALSAQVRLSRADGGPVDPHLALFAADHGDPADAVALMRREWAHTRSVITADALAWALHRDGRSGEALEYVRRAASAGWDNALFRYHRGAVEAALGLPGARRQLRAALETNPHFSPYHALRARELIRE